MLGNFGIIIFALVFAKVRVELAFTVGTENGACSRLIARDEDPELDM